MLCLLNFEIASFSRSKTFAYSWVNFFLQLMRLCLFCPKHLLVFTCSHLFLLGKGRKVRYNQSSKFFTFYSCVLQMLYARKKNGLLILWQCWLLPLPPFFTLQHIRRSEFFLNDQPSNKGYHFYFQTMCLKYLLADMELQQFASQTMDMIKGNVVVDAHPLVIFFISFSSVLFILITCCKSDGQPQNCIFELC